MAPRGSAASRPRRDPRKGPCASRKRPRAWDTRGPVGRRAITFDRLTRNLKPDKAVGVTRSGGRTYPVTGANADA